MRRDTLTVMRFFNKTMLWLTIVPVMILIIMIGATAGDEVEEGIDAIRSAAPLEPHGSTMIVSPPEPELAEEEPEKKAPAVSTSADYEGWQNWCEPVDYEKACKEDKDCEGIEHAAQRPLRCVRPWYSKDPEYRVCAPGYSGRGERRWRRARLRELIAQQYFDETEHCSDWSWNLTLTTKGNPKKYAREWANGKPTHRQFWKCGRASSKAEDLTDFLWLIYFRETSARPWKRHRLNPDIAANKLAYVKHAERYGWIVETECIDSRRKKCRSKHKMITDVYPDPDADQHNPHYDQRFRFQFGLGGLGQNTALWLALWDMMAPPEALCLEPVQFETYLRNARAIVKKLDGGIDCDGDLKKDYWDKAPTWVVVHRGASGGKVCPPKSPAKAKRQAEYERKFTKRAERVGLDPNQIVTIEMLGNPIARDGQNDRLHELLTILDEKLPAPFDRPTLSANTAPAAAVGL